MAKEERKDTMKDFDFEFSLKTVYKSQIQISELRWWKDCMNEQKLAINFESVNQLYNQFLEP